jgi:hypothetical protein
MYSEISANKRKTVLLLIGFILFVGGIGWIFGQYSGNPSITPYVLLGAAIYALVSYAGSSKLGYRCLRCISWMTQLPMPLRPVIINGSLP